MQGFATLRRRRLTLKIRISYIVIRIYKLPLGEFFEVPYLYVCLITNRYASYALTGKVRPYD